MSRLGFKVEQKIFDDILDFRDKLPNHATGSGKEGGMEAYDHPAGLALLGESNGMVDTVVPLNMSGGCWDAPNISYKDMDIGFRALLKTGRRCVGMAFIRHSNWGRGWEMPRYEAKLSQNIRLEIHRMKNSFEDITKTLWIVVHNKNFRFFKPALGESNRLTISEVKAENKIVSTGDMSPFIAAKFKKDKEIKAKNAQRKKELAAEKQKKEEAIKKKLQTIAERRDQIEKDYKERKKETIDLGNGMSYIKNHEGHYILWQTGY